ncbi:kinesin heavy chain [Microbotryum lychnidis-dioicae p1A1 Lamole]|uniref:Kinesin-like protein n=1 Tax=Microbotryum lychnidis-dioicae (strain p1A1 Lamole / MvSl-1064) TaxID=683840 RepID=U5H6P1_USTV1|nr:kinesin heavy chain [Microbotryum lychnidis-dioicae p1A1 Lamole]|eukprot:KDE06743.1 kinesin heavy chain [Microbotryum lychnidis-dioicae p1A1 Lamole]
MSNNIKVVCRFRPPNALELRETGGDSIIVIDEEGTNVKIKGLSGADAQGFTFDRAFQMDTKQVEVFEYGVKSIVDDVMDGYNGTVFAYGQTGSGKSHTMMGPDIDNDDMKGIIPRITEQIFQSIMASPGNIEYLVKVSYMEIYMERIRDLLAPQNDNLPIHEDKAHGVYVKGLADFYVSNSAEVFEVMRQGGNARAVSSTNMNAESSRSHSVFVITIQARNVESGTQKTGTLYLVDLAGSEKVGKTGASGQTLEEAKKINKSLSALGMVINALTDGKSSHVPYRDSKLTRILQESLGGNSRTTLIINCSPSAYNQDETISTLRFGMRAKSIKNKARVNAELSPAELKQLLKKAQRDTANAGAYIALLEAEINVWRSGGKVDEDAWASMEKALGLGAGELEKLVGGGGRAISPAGTGTLSGKVTPTPRLPALDRVGSLAEGDISRPMTPLGQDERDDFLRRENELGDLLAKTESQLSSQEKLIGELRDELSTLKEQETLAANENKSMASELSDLRLQVERLVYESKEGAITTDSLKDQNAELSAELEELKKTMSELKVTQKSATQEGKDKKKAEKMAAMMAGLEAGGMSEKEAEIRASLARLDEASTAEQPLSAEDLTTLRRQLEDSHSLVREHQERSKRTQEENEILTRRKDELEARLAGLEAEYEELLDKSLIEDERGAEADVQEIKHKLETQYAMKLEAAVHDASDLRQQLELKSNEVKTLTASTESLRSANAELERAFKITAAGIEGGQSLAESAKDMERVRKSMAAQLAEFDTMKKNLMKDLQNRCERVVELEISLDETQEQYKNVLKNSNSKIQQRKMDFLTRNLDQLTAVQKELVEQNSLLKKGCAVAERKLIARNEHIRNLEVALQEAKDKVALESDKFEEKLRLVRARLDHAKEQQQQQPTLNSSLSFGRIAKPLRGGGAAGAAMGPARVDSSSSLAKATSGFFARPSSFFGASPAR